MVDFLLSLCVMDGGFSRLETGASAVRMEELPDQQRSCAILLPLSRL